MRAPALLVLVSLIAVLGQSCTFFTMSAHETHEMGTP